MDSRTGEVFVAKKLKRDIASIVTLPVIVTDESAPTLQEGRGTMQLSFNL